LEISNHANEMASISGFMVGDLMQTEWAIFNSVSPIKTFSRPSIFSIRMPLLTALANSSAAGPFPLNQFLGGVVGNHQLVPAYSALIRLVTSCSGQKYSASKVTPRSCGAGKTRLEGCVAIQHPHGSQRRS
jgi:hypothetical protein